jgi:hypothetical protein
LTLLIIYFNNPHLTLQSNFPHAYHFSNTISCKIILREGIHFYFWQRKIREIKDIAVPRVLFIDNFNIRKRLLKMIILLKEIDKFFFIKYIKEYKCNLLFNGHELV